MNHIAILSDLQFGFSRRIRIETQTETETAECGLACLAMIATYHGYDTDLPSLRRRFPLSLRGTTLPHLMTIVSSLHLTARAVRVELDELRMLKLPCNLHWEMNHFVVLQSVRRNRIVISDPAKGLRKLSFVEASRSITGVALELTPAEKFMRQRDRQQVHLREMMGKVIGLRRSLTQIFLLAIALETITLVGPFYNQRVVDQALISGDRDLLYTLECGF